MQDALRKRWCPSQTPDDWFGVRASTTADGVFKSVSLERWNKMKSKLRAIWDELMESIRGDGAEGTRGWLNFKALQQNVGYLVYISMTYKSIQPYLKGFYLTLYGWRPDRDPEGWKCTKTNKGGQDETMEMETPSDAPEFVVPVERLKADLEALMELTAAEEPHKLRVRPHVTAHVVVGFGDAAKSGYGITAADLDDLDEIEYEHGVWTEEIKFASSNHKEMLNFVNYLHQGIADGTIKKGTEIFLFTDNFVTERAYYRGTSSTPSLFKLVLSLRKLEMQGDIFLHMIWVAGTRLIYQGADGLSRGDLENGVMTGRSMLDFVPINKTAISVHRN